MEKYCKNCGNKIDKEADICIGCGRIVNQVEKKDDKVIWFLLSFLAPIISMVLYLILKGNRKINSRIVLIGVLVKVLLIVIILALIVIYLMNQDSLF